MATEIWTYQDQRLADLDVTGFDVETRDGVIGRVDRATREIGGSYLIVDPGPAMPLGRRVVVPAGVVDTVDLDDRRLRVDTSRDEILSAPEFDPERPLEPSLRDRIGTYYTSCGRTRPSQRSATSATPRPSSATSRPRSATRRRSPSARRGLSSTRSDEPTKAALYDQAKRLGIEGRSKMNKTQLKRAVHRRK